MREVKDKTDGWITTRVVANKHFMRRYFGPQCKTFQAQCPTCYAYAQFKHGGRVEVIIDNKRMLRMLLREEL